MTDLTPDTLARMRADIARLDRGAMGRDGTLALIDAALSAAKWESRAAESAAQVESLGGALLRAEAERDNARDEISRLYALCCQAADEIEAHAEAHTVDGLGPATLLRGLRSARVEYRGLRPSESRAMVEATERIRAAETRALAAEAAEADWVRAWRERTADASRMEARAIAAEAEVTRLRVLGPDTEVRVTVEARAIASGLLAPVVDAWKARVAEVEERVRAAEAERDRYREILGDSWDLIYDTLDGAVPSLSADDLLPCVEEVCDSLSSAREECGRMEAERDRQRLTARRMAAAARAWRTIAGASKPPPSPAFRVGDRVRASARLLAYMDIEGPALGRVVGLDDGPIVRWDDGHEPTLIHGDLEGVEGGDDV